jgi:hypothetical protein
MALSLVVVLGLSGIASAGFTDDYAGTQGGTWGTSTWSGDFSPSGGSLSVTANKNNAKAAKLDLDLASGTAASDINSGGGFVLEKDVDSTSTGVFKTRAFFYIGSYNEQWKGWEKPTYHGTGLFKFEFTITSGTWGSGSVATSVKAWTDTGSGWTEFTPNGGTTHTFNTDNPVQVQWSLYSHASEGGYINMTMGDDVPGSTVGLKIYAIPEPASAVLLLIGLPMLARRRRI